VKVRERTEAQDRVLSTEIDWKFDPLLQLGHRTWAPSWFRARPF